jgi:hypothetical protein
MMKVRKITEAMEKIRFEARPIVDEACRVVGELDQHRVERLDQHVHGECARHRGEAQAQAR